MSGYVLHTGDCLEVMATMDADSVDAVVTDPPYNVGQSGYDDRRADFPAWISEVLSECLRVSAGPVVMFAASTKMREYPQPDWTAVWHKPLTLGYWSTPLIPHWEALLLWRPAKCPCGDVFSYVPARKAEGNGHPNPKPLPLMRRLVDLQTEPGGLVLDPFTGSGTTGVACIEEGRDFIGIETEAEYVDIARARIERAAAQQRLPV